MFDLDGNYRSVFLHSQFETREKIQPQQLINFLYLFFARFVGSSRQFQPDEQRLLFGPLRRHNEIVREQDRSGMIIRSKIAILLLGRIGKRMALRSNLWIVL